MSLAADILGVAQKEKRLMWIFLRGQCEDAVCWTCLGSMMARSIQLQLGVVELREAPRIKGRRVP